MTPADRSRIISRKPGYYQGSFVAMGSPCEVLCGVDDEIQAAHVVDIVAAEAWRIEDKFSRYLPGNIVARINANAGEPVAVDDETAGLLDFAASLHDMSDGRFDITSGALRKAWVFDGGDRVPDDFLVKSILRTVGWDKVAWRRPTLRMQRGMQIDFGGIGKEYAVDKAFALAGETNAAPLLVNFGGDVVARGAPGNSKGWQVGIEALDANVRRADRLIHLSQGALATSGDARRYVLKDGVRYGHILDPRTGWPVAGAPRSVTVAADTCTQAGMFATLAMLEGAGAEAFLETQGVQFWIQR